MDLDGASDQSIVQEETRTGARAGVLAGFF